MFPPGYVYEDFRSSQVSSDRAVQGHEAAHLRFHSFVTNLSKRLYKSQNAVSADITDIISASSLS